MRDCVKYCESCGEPLDDWQSLDGSGGFRYEGRILCRFCYLEAVQAYDEETDGSEVDTDA